MRLATYRTGAVVHAGVVVDDSVFPFEDGVTMRDLVEAGLEETHELADRATSRWPTRLDRVQLLAPLVPASVRDFVAFEEHVEGVRKSVDGVTGVAEAWYDAPTFYFTNPHAILGPDDVVAFPAACVARDFELEVAAVITGEASSLSVEQAEQHLFGYTLFNDWSARDLQGREMQVGLGPAKGKDFGSTLGPWIVTADELEPYRNGDGFLQLGCSVSVNGTEVGSDVLSNMGWSFATLLAYASRDSRVVSGDLLGSGTTGHGGCLAELWGRAGSQTPPPLQPGDVVTLTVEGIGSLSNKVGVAPPSPPLPPFRRSDYVAARAR
ncbi:fumarylacetoacetate hydrolase family protein [uncultured Friedmanniella sp.]|uniref:fumarylacetoacetate hydrolase family protein n=1 Tax=uncultured Friedmanniella sp. TaxID=335381 RepID=UPI0035CC63D5